LFYREFCFHRFQPQAPRPREPPRDARSANNNRNAKKGSPNPPDNKQKEHDNKRVNKQVNNSIFLYNKLFYIYRRKNINL